MYCINISDKAINTSESVCNITETKCNITETKYTFHLRGIRQVIGAVIPFNGAGKGKERNFTINNYNVYHSSDGKYYHYYFTLFY